MGKELSDIGEFPSSALTRENVKVGKDTAHFLVLKGHARVLSVSKSITWVCSLTNIKI